MDIRKGRTIMKIEIKNLTKKIKGNTVLENVNHTFESGKVYGLHGRKHTVEQTIEAFRLARHVGFDNINMDLIIGLPGENEDDFRDTLHRIKELNPDSLTIHSLVVKRASRLRSVLDEEEKKNSGKADGILSENDKAAVMEKMLDIGQKFAKSEGYEPYYMYRQKNSAGHFGSSGQENIGYARKGKECIYNILIMEEKQGILAAGAGASTKKMLADEKVKRCEHCGNMEFPKICPAVIIGVTDGDKILMSKYAGRVYKKYALLAGFTEIGETIEETVQREVMEEVGLKVKNIRYYKSQPWALSGSLLYGYFCELDGDDSIHLQEDELSVGKWFHADELDIEEDDVSLTRQSM